MDSSPRLVVGPGITRVSHETEPGVQIGELTSNSSGFSCDIQYHIARLEEVSPDLDLNDKLRTTFPFFFLMVARLLGL